MLETLSMDHPGEKGEDGGSWLRICSALIWWKYTSFIHPHKGFFFFFFNNSLSAVAESLHCSLETITTLLIGYTPIQNVFGVFFKKNLKIKKK